MINFEKIKKYTQNSVASKDQNLSDEFNFYAKECEVSYTDNFYSKFKNRLKRIYMDTVKADRFIEVYMGRKVPTAKLIETILQKLNYVWQAQNQSFSVELKNNSLNEEAEKYCIPFINEIKSKWIHETKESLISYLVITQKLEKNIIVPKINFIKSSEIIYVKTLDNGICNEIAYRTDKDNEVAYIDNEFYYLIDIQNSTILQQIPHNNGFTPACEFKPALHIFNTLFSDFFEYTRAKVELFKKYINDLNIDKSIPKEACGAENIPARLGTAKCTGGKLYYITGSDKIIDQPVINEDGEHEYCPNCGVKIHIGSGSVTVYDVQMLKDAGLSPNQIVSYVEPPTETTKIQQNLVNLLEKNIIHSTVGVVKDNVTLQRNETDIQSDYEESGHILKNFGTCFSIPLNTVIRTILNFKYLKENVVSSNFYFGDKWFLISRVQLINEKNSATNAIERLDSQKKIINYDYQHDPEKLKTQSKLYEILPYAGMTDVQFFELIDKGLVSNEDVELRTNIFYYISEFEKIKKNSIQVLDIEYIKDEINKIVKEKLSNKILITKKEENGNTGII